MCRLYLLVAVGCPATAGSRTQTELSHEDLQVSTRMPAHGHGPPPPLYTGTAESPPPPMRPAGASTPGYAGDGGLVTVHMSTPQVLVPFTLQDYRQYATRLAEIC